MPNHLRPHVGLARCAVAIVILTICFPLVLGGIGDLVSGILFDDRLYFGAGGYADLGIIAQHRVTGGGLAEWAQRYMAATLGFGVGILALMGYWGRQLWRRAGLYR